MAQRNQTMALGVGGFGSAAATASRSPRSRGRERQRGKWREEEGVSEALAWLSSGSTGARRGGASWACTPRDGQPMNRSATTFTERFLKRLNRGPVARLTAPFHRLIARNLARVSGR